MRAWAGDNYGDFPFEWFIIRNQKLKADTWDGYGQTTVTVPAGVTNLDVTPWTGAALGYYAFDVEFVKDKLYWQNMVMDEIDADSGVTIENYKAYKGFLLNRANFRAVYAFYQKVFKEQPTEYYWMGLGRMAGSPLYAGLSDAEYFKDGLVVSGHPATALDAGLFQHTIIGMSISVYSDVAWQFEAYRKGGLAALEEIAAIPANQDQLDIDAWRTLDEGICGLLVSARDMGYFS